MVVVVQAGTSLSVLSFFRPLMVIMHSHSVRTSIVLLSRCIYQAMPIFRLLFTFIIVTALICNALYARKFHDAPVDTFMSSFQQMVIFVTSADNWYIVLFSVTVICRLLVPCW